jgi:hypothetical protein
MLTGAAAGVFAESTGLGRCGVLVVRIMRHGTPLLIWMETRDEWWLSREMLIERAEADNLARRETAPKERSLHPEERAWRIANRSHRKKTTNSERPG